VKRIIADATVHEKTVVKAAANLDEVKVRRRRKKAEPSKNGEVNHITVHPEVWATALTLAGGDRHRVQVFGPENVLVHNTTEWRSRVTK
jgi:hypothetical protein